MNKLLLLSALLLPLLCPAQIVNTWLFSAATYDTGKPAAELNSHLKGGSVTFTQAGAFTETGYLARTGTYRLNAFGNKLLFISGGRLDSATVVRLTSDTLVLHSGIVRRVYTTFK
jgi:hypothetical protein